MSKKPKLILGQRFKSPGMTNLPLKIKNPDSGGACCPDDIHAVSATFSSPTLTIVLNDGSSFDVDLTALIPDGVVNGVSILPDNITLEITTTVGGPFSVDLSALKHTLSLWGNVAFVDAVNGDDVTGEVGKKDKSFATIHAAVAAAVSGQKVMILPGLYEYDGAGTADPVDSLRLVKAGVRVYAQRGVHIRHNATGLTGSALFSDDGVGGDYYFQGHARYEDLRDSTFQNSVSTNVSTRSFFEFDILQTDHAFIHSLYNTVSLVVYIEDFCQNRLHCISPLALSDVTITYKAEKVTKVAGVTTNPFLIQQTGPTMTNGSILIETNKADFADLVANTARRILQTGEGTSVTINTNSESSTGTIGAVTATFGNRCFLSSENKAIRSGAGDIAVNNGGDWDGKIKSDGKLASTPGIVSIGTKWNGGAVNWDVDLEIDSTGSGVGVVASGGNGVNVRNSLSGRIRHTGNPLVPFLQTSATLTSSMMFINLRVETTSNDLVATTTVSTPMVVSGFLSNKAPALAPGLPPTYLSEAIDVIPTLTV